MNKRKLSAFVAAALIMASASPVAAASQTSVPNTSNVKVSNNVNKSDMLMITGLSAGDIIKVYRDNFSSTVIGQATVPAGSTFVTVSIPQLGTNAGTIYLTVTNPGKQESGRVPKSYDAEPQSDAPFDNEITVINGAMAGIVKIQNLESGDIVKIYKDLNKTRLLGTAVVDAGNTEVSVNTQPLGSGAGDIYITVTSSGKRESDVVTKHYAAAVKSDAPLANEITIANNGSGADIITVENLEPGDIVKIYRDSTSTRVLGTATVAAGQTNAAVSITQLGLASGSVWVSVTSLGRTESARTETAYGAEIKSDAPSANEIFVINNKSASDAISVVNLEPGDVVKIYRDQTSTKPAGTATVATGKNDVTINVGQLSVNPAVIYVTVTTQGKQESDRTARDYSAEVKTDKLYSEDITVTNNPIIPDTVVVENLQPGDTVKVYNGTSTKVLGTATVPAGKANVTVSIPQLDQVLRTINVTVTASGCAESDPVSKTYGAEAQTNAPASNDISVINNAFPGDTVRVLNLEESAVVKVYRQGSTKVLGTATVAPGYSEATVTIGQLGQVAGSVDVTITNPGKAESDKVAVAYGAEVVSQATALFPDDITVTNNAAISDTVRVDNLSTGDIIKVYNDAAKTKMLGTAAVAAGKNYAVITIPQLTSAAGKVYVTVTRIGTSESTVTAQDYAAEGATDKLAVDDITITNNTGTADTVRVENLNPGEIIKIYRNSDKLKVLGTATVASGKTNVIVNIAQLGEGNGTVYITITEPGKAESDTLAKSYSAEGQTDSPSVLDITTANNAGSPDKVKVENLEFGDTVKVYDSLTAGKLLGTAKVAAGKNDATVSIAQLGQEGGSVYVSVTSVGKVESGRVQASFDAEPQSYAPEAADITVENNKLAADIVRVQNLSAGDVVKVYRDPAMTKLLGTAAVASGKTEAAVSIAQLGNNVDTYITVTTPGKLESTAVKVSSGTEDQTEPLLQGDITTVNNSDSADAVKVINLKAGDIVNVYRQDGTKAIGTATVEAGKTDVTIIIGQLGVDPGNVFVTVTSPGKLESSRTQASFAAEGKTAKLSEDNIIVTNNINADDEIEVDNLTEGDTVKIYKDSVAADPLATATVEQGKTSTTVKVNQLEGTSIYVSLTNQGKIESDKTEKTFASEADLTTVAPDAEDITIVNNGIIADTVTVGNLTPGDTVKVYRDSGCTQILGTAIVAAGKTDVTMSVAQLGGSAGKVYVKLQTPGKAESTVIEKAYTDEAATEAPSANDITVSNNSSVPDTVKVDKLNAGDIIKIYAGVDANGKGTGKALGIGAVPAEKTSISINISQLGTSNGKIYVSATTPGKLESSATLKNFVGEASTNAPLEADITVTNNAVIADSVRVENLTAGDVVKVYDGTMKRVLGTATVAAGKTNAIINISQLGTDTGKINVTLRAADKLESVPTEVVFAGEGQTDAPSADDIFITNNGIIQDKVRVVNLSSGDIVKVYDAKGKALGTATVATGKTEATVSIIQLGANAGTVSVTVKSPGKLESNKVSKNFAKEVQSDPLSANAITITNNANSSDSIRVVNLTPGDIIKVYRDQSSTKVLGQVSVASGKTEATINISQLGSSAGTVWISVIKPGKTESIRVSKGYLEEGKSSNLSSDQITIIGK